MHPLIKILYAPLMTAAPPGMDEDDWINLLFHIPTRTIVICKAKRNCVIPGVRIDDGGHIVPGGDEARQLKRWDTFLVRYDDHARRADIQVGPYVFRLNVHEWRDWRKNISVREGQPIL